MKINENTTSEEVKQQTKKILMQLCNSFDNSHEEQQGFDDLSACEDNFNLGDEAKGRVIGLKQQIERAYATITISTEEVIEFLKEAIHYDDWATLACDESWSIEEKVEYFLYETPDDEILRIFDAKINSSEKYPNVNCCLGENTNIAPSSNKTLACELK